MMLAICPWLQVTWLTTTTTTTWSNVTWRLHEKVTLLVKWCDLQVFITCLKTLLFLRSHEHMAEANFILWCYQHLLLLTFKYVIANQTWFFDLENLYLMLITFCHTDGFRSSFISINSLSNSIFLITSWLNRINSWSNMVAH